MNESPFNNAASKSGRDKASWGYNSYNAVNATRELRYQAREMRRWGDPTYWGIPTPVLWLEDPFVVSPFEDVVFVEPAFIDIWAL
jgi:hypothetical protein